MRSWCRYLAFAACIVLGGGMLGYPVLLNRAYQRESYVRIQEYEDFADRKEEQEIEEILERAAAYNQSLVRMQAVLTDPFLTDESVREAGTDATILDLEGTGQIGYIEIPCIDVRLPIYEGSSEEALAKGAVHLEGSSLPVGGESTHTVIAGHTGLENARLFTDLIAMQEGDFFYLHVLDRTYCYCVSQIKTVLPEETESLVIREGLDLCTLLTCTPYGVNTHRLLVTGERTGEETLKKDAKAGAETAAFQKGGAVSPLKTGAGIAVCLAGTVLVTRHARRYVKERKRRG